MKANKNIIGLLLWIIVFNTGAIKEVRSALPNQQNQRTIQSDTLNFNTNSLNKLPDTIRFNLFTGDRTSYQLFLRNIFFNADSTDVQINYGPQNNYALEFNGLDGCVDCGNDSSLNINGSLTIEAWTYAYKWERNRNILKKGRKKSYRLGYNKINESLNLNLGINKEERIPINATGENQWHHIAAVYDYPNNAVRVFFDGMLEKQDQITGDIGNNDQNLYIGCGGPALYDIFRPHLWGGRIFKGILDEVRLWKTARTEAQIQKFMYTQILTPDTNLLGYWKFNEGAGNIAYDASVNNNNGIIFGGVKYLESASPTKIHWLQTKVKPTLDHNIMDLAIIIDADATGLNEGIYSADIVLSNLKKSENLIVPVSLHVKNAPDIFLLKDSLIFRNSIFGKISKRSFQICNFGFDTLFINNFNSSNTDFTTNIQELWVPPYGSKKVGIDHSPGFLRPHEGELFISSNDPDQPITSLHLESHNIIIPLNLILRWSFYTMLLILLLILRFIYSKYRLKQKANKTLSWEVQKALDNQKKQQQIIVHQSRLTSLGQLASGIAHEVNQPLQNLLLAAESLQMELLEKNPDIEYIRSLITEQYKDVDKIGQISGHINFIYGEVNNDDNEKLNINACIYNTYTLMQKQFENHNIRVHFDLDKKIPEVVGNPIKFEQVVVNLLNNARDATDEKDKQNIPDYQKQVKVLSGRYDGSVFMEISDNGIGIPDDYLTSIFLPYFTTKVLGKGTGLGLSISYRIVNEMKGKIEVNSKVNMGSAFKISLPVYE
ncbi:MAG: hypothetical protein KQI35_16675 [Bacteroidetes bacterium]|nr:hypothetical protein [Bacteroidota bacterium]